MGDAYRFAAPIYDVATRLWSGGAIWKTRIAGIATMQAEEQALFVGSGHGRAAVAAAQRGVRVTGLDRSPAMLRRARAWAQRQGVAIEWIEADAAHWSPAQPVDHVCAHHFLNVFDPGPMQQMRERLWQWVAPGGSLHIADFRPPYGSLPSRWLQRAHHAVPLTGCWALTGNARHGIYDHDRWRPNDATVSTWEARVYGIGPRWYRAWRFRKNA